MAINFKEYTRLRDIVRKRNIRLSEAGLAPRVHFPTVAEIKSGFVSPSEALKAVKEYYSGGTTVKAVRQTGLAPVIRSFPRMPKPQIKSDAERKDRKRASDRAYRRRKAVREMALTPEKKSKYASYLKALETVSKVWKQSGFDIGIDLASMTPAQAKSFVDYMDYRFSQGDFNQHYVIDEFIQDFSKLMKKGYKGSDIQSDFNKFLEHQNQLRSRSENMEGLSSGEIMGLWDKFIGD